MSNNILFNVEFRDKFSKVGQKLRASVSGIHTAMKKVQAAGPGMANALKRVAEAAQKSAEKMKDWGKKLTYSLTLPIAGFAALAIKSAAAAEEMESKLGVVFGKSADDMRKWADQLAATTNRGSNDIRNMSANMGDFLKGLAFKGPELNNMTKSIVTLVQDLSSFKDVDPQQVFIALQGSMVGNNEALKTLGISLLQNEVQMRAMQMTGKRSAKMLTIQEKAAASYQIILEKTADAQGDAARTAQSFTNQWRGFTGALKDFAIEVGKTLIPIAKPVVVFLTDMLRNLKKVSPGWIKFGLGVAAVVAVVGPLLVLVGTLTIAIGAITAPIAIAVAGVLAFVSALTALLVYKKQIIEWFKALFTVLAALVTVPVEFYAKKIGQVFDWLGKKFEAFQELIDGIVGRVMNFVANLSQGIQHIFGFDANASLLQENKVSIDVNVNDPGNALSSVKTTQSRSSRKQLNTGLYMAGAAG